MNLTTSVAAGQDTLPAAADESEGLKALSRTGAVIAAAGDLNGDGLADWLVGAPAYVDAFVALPLTRSLLEHGMSTGAAMSFLVSGGVVSIWGAIAIFPVLKLKPFLLYLSLAAIGSMAAGSVFGLLV